MARLQQSLVMLRIWGDDLLPEDITAMLGRAPTFSHVKGDPIVGHPSGQARIARTGAWDLRAADREPEDIDGQVREVLSGLTNDLSVWRRIRENYKIDLFCGLFMGSGNEGLVVSPATLVALGVRGIELALDLYAPRIDG